MRAGFVSELESPKPTEPSDLKVHVRPPRVSSIGCELPAGRAYDGSPEDALEAERGVTKAWRESW